MKMQLLGVVSHSLHFPALQRMHLRSSTSGDVSVTRANHERVASDESAREYHAASRIAESQYHFPRVGLRFSASARSREDSGRRDLPTSN